MEKRIITKALMILKFVVFASFFITAFVMYRLGNKEIAMVIVISILFFMVFIRLDNLDKRIKELE